MRRSLGAVLAVLIGLAAFAPTPAHAETLDEFALKLVQVLEQFGNTAEANMNSCSAMGDKLEKLYDQHGLFLETAKVRSTKLTPDEKKQMETKYKTRADAALAKMSAGFFHCGRETKVAAVMRKLK